MAETMILREKGGPVEATLRFASKRNLISDARLVELRKELCDLVEEVTKKFIGFVAAKSVKKGQEMALGVIDLALEHATDGAYEPDIWAKLIDEKGFKTLSTETIGLFKKLAALPYGEAMVREKKEIDLGETDVKSLFAQCFIHSSQEPYQWYQLSYSSRYENKCNREFLEWLLQKKTGSGIKYWRDQLDRPDADDPDIPDTISVINSILMREALRLDPKPYLTYDEAIAAQKALRTKGKKWMSKARERFNLFLATVPEGFHSLHVLEDWFDSKFMRKPKFFSGDDMEPSFYIIAIPPKVKEKMMNTTSWETERKPEEWEKDEGRKLQRQLKKRKEKTKAKAKAKVKTKRKK